MKAYYTSPALIPINTKPLILYHLEFYSQQDCQIFIIVNQKDSLQIEENVNLNDFDFNIIEVPDSHSVNESLAYALDRVPAAEETIINLVTSIPLQFPAYRTIYLEKQLSYNNDWSCININSLGIEFFFKWQKQKKLGHAFTGIFNIDNATLAEAINHVTGKSDLMEIISYVFNTADKKNLFKFQLNDWIDAGHELNYYQSKLKLITSRSFNSVSVNELGVLKKNSLNFDKLKNEVEFILSVPPKLSVLYPRIIDNFLYDNVNKSGSYSMEFYGYPNIAELQLFWDLKDEIWTRIFADLESVLKLFIKERYSIGKKAYNDFYIGKIDDRVNDFLKQLDDDYKSLVTANLVINGVHCKSYHQIKDELFKRIDQLYSEEDFCIAHGDLCFNNILYDVSHRLIKLIDPRGSFGSKCVGLYGDVKYDLAKLLHSAIGGYDYLVNNLYKVNFTGDHVEYNIFFRENNQIISSKAAQLIANLGYSLKDIMLIVGTLFLSMPPLHADSANRQRIMYVHGLFLINENL